MLRRLTRTAARLARVATRSGRMSGARAAGRSVAGARVPSRGFAGFGIPKKKPGQFGGDCSDGFFRMPEVAAPDEELNDEDEFWNADAQAPEMAYDIDPDVKPSSAAFQLLAVLGAFFGAFYFWPDPREMDTFPGEEGNILTDEAAADYQKVYHPNSIPGSKAGIEAVNKAVKIEVERIRAEMDADREAYQEKWAKTYDWVCTP